MRVAVVRIGTLALCVAVPLLLGAGATSRIFALSPENQQAESIGPLSAYLEGHGGEGDIWLKLPNGQVLKGRFKINVGGSVGAYGKSRGIDKPGGAYSTSGYSMEHASPAVIDMAGPGGATVHCEVMNDDHEMSGSGVCLFSNGAEYRVVY
jgi:hypothetical protein